MRWRKKDAADEEIARALSIAQAAEFVDALPEKYDSIIDQGGKTFPAGRSSALPSPGRWWESLNC